MQVNRVGNQNFKAIILDCKNPVPAEYLFSAKNALDKNRPDNDFNPMDFLNGELLPKVIESDYDTVELKERYDELVQSQKDNPVDIHLDLYLADPNEIPLYPEGWYQKATVAGKVFKQRIYEFQGSAIKFLEDACRYANKLNRRQAKD
ncbi:hypothetical protein IJI31_03610 [bacterium]|nr:hypothetical protein [bacterium]